MNTVRELHDEAMRLAHLALIARHNQEWEKAEELARQAYDYEAKAASLIPEDKVSEPTRSIFYRSAASLAYQCKELKIAQRLIAKALSGYPPPQVEQELKDLFEEINFENHLKVQGQELGNEDLQLSMQGKSVGYGKILYDEFIHRVMTTRKLIDRTIQRVMGASFQRIGRVSKYYQPFVPTLSTARAGSFAITIRLAVAKDKQLPMFVTPAQIFDEIIDGIKLINEFNEENLREKIKHDTYFKNFLSLTKDMAPDGEKISFVGFTSLRKSTALTRQRSKIEILPETEEDLIERSPISVEGILDYATSRRHKESIGLTTDKGKSYSVIVEEGLDDLVRRYFDQRVAIKGKYDGKYIYLTDVQASDK